ncbi:hypothetical protein [Vagococcus intermedius]|uniref:Uncharacterized protein n=1 Tax=Vagococcus intermedius TaxID=2991418 RepID=A0AAF0CVW3_9ENTE|nr:hypothetical protein [Vagococcus intermedius]WEG73806.1 hypothetical protein OL234_02525 [Vagococcus intermedius]WEG75891.1 hypothetical protein OL235_02535 [Vagococcus intermedius]
MVYKINKDKSTSVLDVNEATSFLGGCQVVKFAKITNQTLFLMDLSEIASHYHNKTLLINYLNVPLIVSRSVNELIGELNQELLIDLVQQKKVMTQEFGKRYRLPILSGRGVFVPFSQGQWYNLFFIEGLLKSQVANCLGENCRVIFSGKCDIIFPKTYRSFLTNLQKDLCLSYYLANYFSELALRQVGCKKNYSKKIKQLLIRFKVPVPQDLNEAQLKELHFFLARCQVEAYLMADTKWGLSEIEELIQIS